MVNSRMPDGSGHGGQLHLFSLVRVAQIPSGAFGALLYQGVPIAVTLERTYTVDSVETVKIPPGVWPCTRTRYYRGDYDTYEVHVQGHSRILFHKGNTEGDSEGCILVANSYGELRGDPAVLDSGVGFARFIDRCGGRPTFDLEVR